MDTGSRSFEKLAELETKLGVLAEEQEALKATLERTLSEHLNLLKGCIGAVMMRDKPCRLRRT